MGVLPAPPDPAPPPAAFPCFSYFPVFTYFPAFPYFPAFSCFPYFPDFSEFPAFLDERSPYLLSTFLYGKRPGPRAKSHIDKPPLRVALLLTSTAYLYLTHHKSGPLLRQAQTDMSMRPIAASRSHRQRPPQARCADAIPLLAVCRRVPSSFATKTAEVASFAVARTAW